MVEPAYWNVNVIVRDLEDDKWVKERRSPACGRGKNVQGFVGGYGQEVMVRTSEETLWRTDTAEMVRSDVGSKECAFS